ncbi:hypothetical protein TNCV_3959201 [Trichonephila clavipes]|nr:hypothetical protein TNCV_3959201 [Trichonephila clavipes]
MACERKLLESEATTGFFVLLGTKGKKETLEWCMKANLIASRYECPRCKKEMRLQERKGTVDCYEWRCRSQSKDNPHDVVRIKDGELDKFYVHPPLLSSESSVAAGLETVILGLQVLPLAWSGSLGKGRLVRCDPCQLTMFQNCKIRRQ